MNTATFLPALNAVLNGAAALFLIHGYTMIRRRDRQAHQRSMVRASVLSGVFLVSYVIKTMLHGTTVYGGTGILRTIYLFTLGTHLILAMTLPIFAGLSLYFAFRKQFRRHRRIARFALPVWLYVSVTGVAVFFLLRPWY